MAQYPILRLAKGSALSYGEMDGNLSWLAANLNGNPDVYITGSSVNITGSTNIIGNLIVRGTGSFDVLVMNYFSSSIVYSSGSTKFGDTSDDTHQFTGSVTISGSFILPRVGSVSSYSSLTQGLFTYVTASGINEGAWQYTNTYGWVQLLHASSSITASNVLGGVTNYVARWTGATTLGIGTILDNGTNVGIGNTIPISSPNYRSLSIAGTNGAELYLYSGSLISGVVYADLNGLTLNAQNSKPVIIYAGLERMRVNSNGNVLIGTTTDAGYKLDVNGTLRVQGATTISPGSNGMTVIQTVATNTNALYVESPVGGVNDPASATFRVRNTGGSRSMASFGDVAYFDQMGRLVITVSGTNVFLSGGIIMTGSILAAASSISISGNNPTISTTYTAASNENGLSITQPFAGGVRNATSISMIRVDNRSLQHPHLYLSNNNTNPIMFDYDGAAYFGTTTTVASSLLTLESTTRGFLPTRTNSTASITAPVQGLMTFINTSGSNEGLWQFTTGSGWVQLLHTSSSISASSIIGLNLSRIATGSVTASVDTGTNTFNVRSGSASLYNILNTGQQIISSPTMVLSSSNSGYLISQSLTHSGSNTLFSRLTAVNITPTFFSTSASQTEIALRVSPTFTGSYTGSLMSNVIVDFGTTTSGSILLIDDVTSGSVYAVNDYFGLPVLEIFSDAQVNMYDYPYAVFNKSGSYLTLGLPSTLAVDSAVNVKADLVMDEGFGFSTRTAQGNGTTLNDSTASLYTYTFGAQSGSVFMSAVVTGYDSASRDMISGEVKSSIRYRAGTATIVGTNFRLINADNNFVNFDIAVSSNTAVLRAYGTGSRTYIWGATITTQII